MNLKVFEPPTAGPQETFLKLIQESDGDVTVIAVDKAGKAIENGHLVSFRTNGTVYLHRSINGSLGFQLDSQDRLVQK